jgi:chemotaxis protein MotB
MADDKPIIVIKKKGGHGGHHGGAWKIAYADFVTAMMAFFMVMWLLSAAQSSVRKSISSYFRRPGIFSEGSGTPLMIGANGILNDGVPPAQYKGTMEIDGTIQEAPKRKEMLAGEDLAEKIDMKIAELKRLLEELKKKGDGEAEEFLKQLSQEAEQQKSQEEKMKELADQIKQEIVSSPELKELLGAVDVKIDADGLNIEIMDTAQSSMFTSGSATILPDASKAFTKLAGILNTVPNKIDIIGHTDAKPYRSRTGFYTNWELSADRANAARKLLESQGLETGRIESVIGKADSELKNKELPEDASNRRITLKIRFSKQPKTDLSKTPDMLKNFASIEQKWRKETETKPDSKETVHSMTVDDVINEAKAEKRKEAIENEKRIAKPTEIEKGLIFQENPVLGPAEFFDR